MQATRTAAIYTRISLDREQNHLAVTRQEEECRALAQRLGLEIVQVFSDNSISAASGKRRPGFEALLRYVAMGKAEVIVSWNLDRLQRRLDDLQRLIDLDADVVTIQAGHIDLSTPGGRLNARVGVAVAMHEGEIRKARQQAAFRQKAADGKPSWVWRPFGYQLDGTPHPVEADLVREAYANLLHGWLLVDIARDWNARGVRTVRETSARKDEGGTWTGPLVKQVLISPRNAGLRAYQKKLGAEPVWGTWQPLVNVDTWRAAERLLSDPERRSGTSGGNKVTTLLSNLVRCAKCGDGMVKVTRSGGRVLYKCSTGHVETPLPWLDEFVWTQAVVEYLPANWAAWNGSQEDEDTARRDEITVKLETASAALRDASDAFAAGDLDLATLKAVQASVGQRRAVLEAELAEISDRFFDPMIWVRGVPAEDIAVAVENNTKHMTLSERRELLGRLFAEIRVKGRGRGHYEMTPDLVEFFPRVPVDTAKAG